MFLLFPNKASLLWLYINIILPLKVNKPDVHKLYSEKYIIEAIKEVGFEIEYVEHMDIGRHRSRFLGWTRYLPDKYKEEVIVVARKLH